MGKELWNEAVDREKSAEIKRFNEEIRALPVASQVLDGIFAHSPYLTRAAASHVSFVHTLFVEGPDTTLASLVSEAGWLERTALEAAVLKQRLRSIKTRASLAVALADIGGHWGVERVTAWLSRIASAALSAATAHVLREQHRRGKILLPDETNPNGDSGLIVLGMGKLGADELNYSSDIDLIILFDPDRVSCPDPSALQITMTRLAQNLVRIMDERTADGYVFRTDLRLRPDPASTPLAVSVPAAEVYYEGQGQNWERAAMIKARPVAGDQIAGERFLNTLTPFIWRKSLDFAQIQDIHSIKRQIDAHRGLGGAEILGHNVKLGDGGIREIEFFAQTQQLIWGGRSPSVRQRQTRQALSALAEIGQCSDQAVIDLGQAYDFMRRVEHRLQMVNDEQTHTLPDSDEGLAGMAAFLGFDNMDAFVTEFRHHQDLIRDHYARLFDTEPRLSAAGPGGGNLVFTGADSDPGTLETLGDLGFKERERTDNLIRDWHRGRYGAMRGSRAREILTEITPCLLSALSETPDPDAALIRFDKFLSALPDGVQLFSMFQAAPWLLNLIIETMGVAPRLAQHMSAHPGILDNVLAPDFFGEIPELTDLSRELRTHMARYQFLDDKFLEARRWANDRRFQVGVQRLRYLIAPHQAASAHADIAEAVLSELLPVVARDFALRHGRIQYADMAIIALGGLGGREMSAASDLDLLFIYGAKDDAGPSDGEKSLPASQYFTRLAQRMISALSSLTAEGALYKVDMRLRPSGSKGPIATSLAGFLRYHAEEAWTWERLALARGRVVAPSAFGDKAFGEKVSGAVRNVLSAPRDPEKLLIDAYEMRERLASEKSAFSRWDVKNVRGGLVDIAFIAQTLGLMAAAAAPALLSHNTWRVLDNLSAGELITPEDGQTLKSAQDLWLALHGMLALTLDDIPANEELLPQALAQALADAGGRPTLTALAERMDRTAETVYAVYRRLIEEPAKTVSSRINKSEGAP